VGKKEQFQKILNLNTWPDEMPQRDVLEHGWLSAENKRNLAGILHEIDEPLVVEIGTWLGLTTKYLLDLRKDLRIITIDSFRGSKEHHKNQEWKKILDAGLMKQAQRNLWDYRKRCCILKKWSILGLQYLLSNKIKPDLIFIDGSHSIIDVYLDIILSMVFFKYAIICGDDIKWPGVRAALSKIQKEQNISSIYENGSFWRIFR